MIAYRMFVDETLVLDTKEGLNDGILSAKFKLEINKAYTMEFSMVATHPLINTITRMSTSILLEMMYIDDNNEIKDDYYPFIGRVTSVNEDMYSNKTFTCEGGSAFDNDYIELNRSEYLATEINNYSVRDILINEVYRSFRWMALASTTIGVKKHCVNSARQYEYDGSEIEWTLMTPIQKPAPSSDSSEEPSEDSGPTYSYETVDSMVNSMILNPFGGVNYYYCSVHGNSYGSTQINKQDFYIENSYFSNLFYGFKYIKGSPSLDPPEEENNVIIPYYGDDVPSFGLNDNIIDIKPSFIKTNIWTGIMAVGKDGLTISGNKNDTNINQNVIWKNELVQNYGRIMKQVNFSQVDNTQALVSFANNYISRFASQDYYAMQTYEINGIEPCEVFEPTEFLIKLGYQVVLDIGNNLVVFPCLSLEHDLFDIQQSRYVVGPLVPDMILNEDFTAVYH